MKLSRNVLLVCMCGSVMGVATVGFATPPQSDVWFWFDPNGNFGQAAGWDLPCDEVGPCGPDQWEAVYLTVAVDNPATSQSPDWVGDTKTTMPDWDTFNFNLGTYRVQGGYSITLTGWSNGELISRTLIVHDLLVDVDADNDVFYGYAGWGGYENKVCVEFECSSHNWPCGSIDTSGYWEVDVSGMCDLHPESWVVPHQWDEAGNGTDLHYESTAARSVRCVGFEPPLATYPVTVRGNRALPLRAELYDAAGYLVTGTDVSAPPVVQILYQPGDGGEAVDVSEDAVSVGKGDNGNQFVYRPGGVWKINLKIRGFSAPGTYTMIMLSGDNTEYVIPYYASCVAQFVVH